MNTELFGVGLAHKFCLAAEAQGYTPELLNALAEKPDLLGQLLQVQLGYAEFKQIEHIINCDTDPFTPDGLKVEEHQKGGQFKWDAKQVELWLSDGQKKGRVEGNKLRKEMAKKTPFNANVLDYLLAHPELIPDEWKGKYVFFWGTIYRDSSGDLYVRCLCWRGSRWDWSGGWVGGGWRGRGPAALRAS